MFGAKDFGFDVEIAVAADAPFTAVGRWNSP
jgi:hypothetical protein